MIRWLEELLQPSLKCARLGHLMVEQQTRVYLYPSSSWNGVADRATETVSVCRRCDYRGEAHITDRFSIQGLTMSTDRWNLLETKGKIAA